MKNMLKNINIMSVLLAGVIMLSSCGKQMDTAQDTATLPADVIIEGADVSIVDWSVDTTDEVAETTGVTYVPIMPDDNYTMSTPAEELEDDYTETTQQGSDAAENTVSTTVPTQQTSVSSVTTQETTHVTQINVTETEINNAAKMIPTLQERLSVNTPAHSWFYTKLTVREQAVYDTLINAALNFDATVTFDTALTREEYARILGIVYIQNPELFWLRGSIELSDDGKTATLYYLCTREQAETLDTFLTHQVSILLTQIPPDADDLKTVQVFHDYICRNSTFMKGGTTASTVIGALVDGASQCLGYAKGLQYLCNIAGIPSLVVTGTNESGASHAWNMIQLGGNWYNVDCTWDDPVLKVFDANNVSYMYFGVRDVDIVGKTHFNVNEAYDEDFKYFEVPVCNSTALNADYVYGYYAKTYEEGYEMLREQMLNAVKTGATVIHVKFAEQSTYLEAIEKLKTNKELVKLKNEINSNTDNARSIAKISVNHTNSLNYFEVFLTF